MPVAIRWSVKDLAFVRHQKVDQGRRRILLVQVDQSSGVDDVILERPTQGHQEHQPVLVADGIEAGEAIVTDLGDDAVAAEVARSGVVDRNPPRRLQAGLLDRRLFHVEVVVAFGQQVGNLPG